jgi:ankyrin repeat protein
MYVKNGWTALHYAARGDYQYGGDFTSMVSLLLDEGADINAQAKVVDEHKYPY